MARAKKASQKPASKSKPRAKTLHQSARKHATGHAVGREKPLVPARLQVSISQLTHSSRAALDEKPFLRFIKKMAHSHEKSFRFQAPALLTLKEASQTYLLELLEDWSLCAHHAKRATVISSDIRLTRSLRGRMS